MPRIRTPPSGPTNVFLLATPHHMLVKLAWEIREFVNTIKTGETNPLNHAIAYRGFNCAVTAWHLTDWTWRYADGPLKQSLARASGFEQSVDASTEKGDFVDFNAFASAISRRCRPLHICRQIANGSKHMKLRSPDPNIRTEAQWVPGAMYRLFIADGDERRPAEDVFKGAFYYWENLLSEVGLIEAKFISSEDRVCTHQRVNSDRTGGKAPGAASTLNTS
jgi:hypothetical protein